MPFMMISSQKSWFWWLFSGFLFCVTRLGVILLVGGEVNEAGIKRRGIWLCGVGVMLLDALCGVCGNVLKREQDYY